MYFFIHSTTIIDKRNGFINAGIVKKRDKMIFFL